MEEGYWTMKDDCYDWKIENTEPFPGSAALHASRVNDDGYKICDNPSLVQLPFCSCKCRVGLVKIKAGDTNHHPTK